ncbi:GlcNAc-transferase family protein [Pantoea dispersa]|uniref:GlcNAc-transferase family protein n=1 Tax=Pantoea dispersa TaxID=59814 RepID=UPI002DB6F671|nr:GlcNAc-transferase family protein [Pantoea dispersa]MEB5973379.1 UDP-N-acetylglucosamine-transferase [Pantoea dispersa]
MNTIFIGIASYRDTELIPTLLDMLAQASQPDRLHIAVCWQDDGDVSPFTAHGFSCQQAGTHGGHLRYRLVKDGAIIDLIAVDYMKSQGACWARHLSNTLFAGQRYHLQIDSHSRFIPHWDDEMIAMLERLRPQSTRPVLSHYPPPYTPDQQASERSTRISRLVFSQFNDKGIVTLKSAAMQDDTPRYSGYLAAGFIFADGHFVENVPYDPQLFFSGEEISLAARAYTHGYDLYTPDKAVLWHYYGRNDAPKFWSDHTNEAKERSLIDAAWWERDAISCQRIRCLLGISQEPVDLGPWGLGLQRTLQAFEQRIGVNFRQQVFIRHHLVKLKRADIDLPGAEVLWWHLSVHKADNTPLMQQQLSPDEINSLHRRDNGETFELRVALNADSASHAHCIRLCPYINGVGWGEIREAAW